MNRYQFAVSHLEWLMGLRKEYAAACIPILDVGTLGFYSQVFTYGGFDNARDIDERPNEVKAVDYSLGGSFARHFLSGRIATGLTVSYVQSILDGEPAASISCDLDALYAPVHWLRARISGRHLGTPARYARAREPQPSEAGVSVHLSPFTTDVGDTTLEPRRITPEAAIGVSKMADGPVKAGIGIELRVVRQFFVRSGYEYRYGDDPSIAGLSAGVGFTLGNYGMDAGWKYQSRDFGSVWSATVRYAAEELAPKTAIEYFRIAEQHFRHDRIRQAIRYAHKALRLNPSLWQAHSLLARTTSRVRRKQGLEIGLVYAGNLRGRLAPRQTGEMSVGGIARAVTAVRSLKAEYPLCIAVEAGNLVEASSTPQQAAVAFEYVRKSGFEAVGVGLGELRFGLENSRQAASRTLPERVCTNLSQSVRARIRDGMLIPVGDRTIAVLCAIDPLAWSGETGSSLLEPLAERITERLDRAAMRTCDLRVLIFHGSWQRLHELLVKVDDIDIVVCGSLSQQFQQPMRVGSAIVLSPGEGGGHVGALTLRFNEHGDFISHDNRLVALTQHIDEDRELSRAVGEVMPVEEDRSLDTALVNVVRTDTAGLFVFVSDRRGMPHVYLKALRRHAELPLTTGHRSCRRPRLSLASRRVVYTVHDDSAQTTGVRVTHLLKSGSKPLPIEGRIDELQFHPAGAWIYAVTTPEGDTAAHIRRTLGAETNSQPVITRDNGSVRWLGMSPEGESIVFSAITGRYWQIHVADTAGAAPIQITDVRGNHIDAAISPDGRYVAYRSDRNGLTGHYDLWVHDREEGGHTRLTFDADVAEYCWYDDSRTLVLSGGNPRTLKTVHAGLGHARSLTHRKRIEAYEELSPRLLRYRGTAKVVYVRSYRTGARRLHWIEIDGSGDTRISESGGNEWLE
jgi:hypothetical protein